MNSDNMESSDRGILPHRFILDFIAFLHRHRDRIEVITYRDFPWEDDWDYKSNYTLEQRRWKEQLKSGERDPGKIYVLLQHDVDRLPERTMILLRHERDLAIPSNVQVFNRLVNRRHLKLTGQIEYKDYPLDDELMRDLEANHRFVIGYHNNAYEQALFDRELATQIFTSDVEALSERFRIDFFSPHGGVRDADGQSNASLHPPADLANSLRWVHNGHTVRFDGSYSDGAIMGVKRDPASRDLRVFVRTWKPGNRYRILLHPQYYFSPHRVSPRLEEVDWYQEVLRAEENDIDVWESVKPGEKESRRILFGSKGS